MREGGRVNSHDGPCRRTAPLPTRSSRGEGEKLFGDDLTQGGIRSSFALGYYQAIPAGFQFGSLRSQKTNDAHRWRGTNNATTSGETQSARPLNVPCSVSFFAY